MLGHLFIRTCIFVGGVFFLCLCVMLDFGFWVWWVGCVDVVWFWWVGCVCLCPVRLASIHGRIELGHGSRMGVRSAIFFLGGVFCVTEWMRELMSSKLGIKGRLNSMGSVCEGSTKG